MKIIEGMKELKIILKKMQKNTELINEYAALPDNERLHFGDRKTQEKEIRSLIQANEDLLKNYLKIKKQIEMTNLQTKVMVASKEYTLSDLLTIKRTLFNSIVPTYKALNDSIARRKLQVAQKFDKTPVIEKYYDEKEKNEAIREWEDLFNVIDSRLEVINATTDLVVDL